MATEELKRLFWERGCLSSRKRFRLHIKVDLTGKQNYLPEC